MPGPWILLSLTAHGVSPRVPLDPEPVVVGPSETALVVKWSDQLGARPTDTGGLHVDGPPPAAALSVLATWQAELSPWIALPGWRLDGLEARAAARSGRAQPDLAALHRVRIPDPTPERLEALGRALLGVDGVEFVAPDPAPTPPPADRPPETPDLTPRQTWLQAPAGLDGPLAWETWGLDGSGIRIADCEYGWHHDHEDLIGGDLLPEAGQTVDPAVADRGWDHHGTAVAGQLVGQHNRYGVDGLAPASTFATYSEWTVERGYDRITAIALAIDDSAPGDVVLLEMQAGGPDGRLAPAEVNQGVWTVVRTGTDAGVIVVAAAGNGSADLDDPAYEAYRDRGDSGAIIVGAGTPDTRRDRLGFSTHGSRVDVHGWGRNVFTTGYGGFARYGDDILQTYTATFGGTSSASPFVAGVAALIQQAVLRYRLEPLDPRELRSLLADTGIAAAPGARIGPFPDLGAALDDVEARYDVPPRIVSATVPETVIEGDRITLAADVALLPTHVGRVWWTAGDQELEGTTASLRALDDGVIALRLTVEDDWGRQDARDFEIRVENAAPSVRIQVEADTVDEGSEARFEAVVTDPGPEDTHTYTWWVGDQVVGTGASLVQVPPDDGTLSVRLEALDDDGARSPTSEATVQVRDVPPTLALDVPETAERGVPVMLSARVVDPGDDTHTITWVLPDGPRIQRGRVVALRFPREGQAAVMARAVDEDGVIGEAITTLQVGPAPRGGLGCRTAPLGSGLGVTGLMGLLLLRRRRS
jgi:hypothetical protein